MMDQSVEKLFERHYQFAILCRLRNSMWRWGCDHGAGNWNTMVRAYNGIRSFDFGISGFTVRFDYTSYVGNERGRTKCTRTLPDSDIFLDGSLGFLVYEGNVHVMTIGFSVGGGDKLLVQQIQLARKKGNRFLFKLPTPYVDYVLSRLRLAFPMFTALLVDGKSLGRNLEGQYKRGLYDACKHFRENHERMKDDPSYRQWALRNLEEYQGFKKRIIVLKREVLARLSRIYGDLHVHRRVYENPETHLGLLFHPIISITQEQSLSSTLSGQHRVPAP